jgi:hypothetical protein
VSAKVDVTVGISSKWMMTQFKVLEIIYLLKIVVCRTRENKKDRKIKTGFTPFG